MPNVIPTTSRNKVRAREQGRCFRCRMPARPGEWSHRRGRSVRDGHENCPCNGLWACHTCHGWLHANPRAAREHGWMVSRADLPSVVPALVHGIYVLLSCDGTATPIGEQSMARETHLVREPIPGSPSTGWYVLDRNDPEFELGPFDTQEAAIDALAEHREDDE